MKLSLRLFVATTVAMTMLFAWPRQEQARLWLQDAAGPGVSYCATVPACPEKIPAETISGKQEARGRFSWNYGYDVRFDGKALEVKVAVHLIPAQGVSPLELDRVKPLWEQGVEKVWNKRFALETSSGQTVPIVVDVSFQGPKFHHHVIVRPGAGRSDELNWNVQDSPQLVAHEFGHMLGLYDEYAKGATAPVNPVIDPGSIMTSSPEEGATPHERHYEPFCSWFVNKTMLSNVRIVHEKENLE